MSGDERLDVRVVRDFGFSRRKARETIEAGQVEDVGRTGDEARDRRLEIVLAHRRADERLDATVRDAVARDEVNLWQMKAALRELVGLVSVPKTEVQPEKKARPKSPQDSGLLIVGVDRLMTQLARCCKPVPPDPVRGFVTRGKGVSVHREDCAGLKRLAEAHPERLIEAEWGKGEGSYAVEIGVTASDRRWRGYQHYQTTT